jgi:hypothetical protein
MFLKHFREVQTVAACALSIGSVLLCTGAENTLRIVPDTVMEFAVDTNVLQLKLDVKEGFAESVAVFVNPTNSEKPFFWSGDMPGAKWESFTPEWMLTLDPKLKRHSVVLGFKWIRSRRTGWNEVGVTITNLPPILTITSPASGIVTTSTGGLQVQGFADVALNSISCRHETPGGRTDEYPGLTTRSLSQLRRPSGVVTNFFQVFDVKLSKGTNLFLVRCEDIYGNVSTTNLTVILATEGDTTPPSIVIIAPDGDEAVPGPIFALLGKTDDASAQMKATITADGQSETRPGLVGRDGDFGFDELPMLGATNVVTVTATDLAGNVRATNITVLRANYTISMDPIPEAEWSQPSMTLNGKISTQDQAIWVNGVRATINPDGTWTATKVKADYKGAVPFLFKIKPKDGLKNEK